VAFAADEVEYLSSQALARLATVDDRGQPDVVPVAFQLDDDGAIWIGGVGESVLRTRKMRNIAAGHELVSIVVDDLVSFEPFVARGVRVHGRASAPVERVDPDRATAARST
jgi:pyridoxamine 5'-phosphate oxidase family protein